MEKTYKELKQELNDLRKAELEKIIDSLPTYNELDLREVQAPIVHNYFRKIMVADNSLTAKELCDQHDNFFNQYELNGLLTGISVGRCNKIKQRHFIECDENGQVIGERITTKTIIYRSYYKI